ncbi:MAG: response regulator [Phycisphaerales bacterium]
MNSTRHILLVDNDPSVLAALQARIAALGYRCTTARSGGQALATFAKDPPELVISDLHMPQGDGATLAEAIRRTSDVPIILISGFKDAFRRQLRQIPDVSFLHKPFETAALLELIQASLAGCPASRSAQRHAA